MKKRCSRSLSLGLLAALAALACILSACPLGNDEPVPTTYVVTFNVEGGSPVESQTVEPGGTVTRPPNPSRDGYTFVDWYKDVDRKTLWDFDTDTVTTNTTIYAKWVQGNLQSYEVTFDTADGAPVPLKQTVVEGEKVRRPQDPAKAGYTFVDWYKDVDRKTPWNFDWDTVTGPTTIYARWVDENAQLYTVTFDTADGSKVESKTVVSGDKVPQPADPTRNGYVFKGWYKEAAGTTPWNFAEDTVTKDTTLYAKWIEAAYKVTFNVDGGSVVEEQTVGSGGVVPKPVDPTRAGYTFAGWHKDPAKTVLWNFDADTVTVDTTLYAKWREGTVQSYTVTFDADGGTPAPAVQTVLESEKVLRPTPDPARAGQTFAGWYRNEAKTIRWNFDSDTVKADITIYAKWIEGTVQSYTVTFNTDGGSAVVSQTVLLGGKVPRPTLNPTRKDHTFEGWYRDADRKTLWDFATDTVTEDTTLYAKWGKNVLFYTVTFNADGGSEVPSQPVESDGKVKKPADPSKDNFVFDGWHKDQAKTIPWDFAADRVTEDTTLYAGWVPSYTVTFVADVDSEVPSQTVVQGGKVTEPAEPARDGHVFGGWYKDAIKWDFNKDTVTGNITLTAHWTEALVVNFTGFSDEAIDLIHEENQTLSKSRYDSLSVYVSGVDDYSEIRWYMDGEDTWRSGMSYYVSASNLSLGSHTLSAIVAKDGVPYSKTLEFQVTR